MCSSRSRSSSSKASKQATYKNITAKQKHKQKKNSISSSSRRRRKRQKREVYKKLAFDTQQMAVQGKDGTGWRGRVQLRMPYCYFQYIKLVFPFSLSSVAVWWRKKAPILGKCALFILFCVWMCGREKDEEREKGRRRDK